MNYLLSTAVTVGKKELGGSIQHANGDDLVLLVAACTRRDRLAQSLSLVSVLCDDVQDAGSRAVAGDVTRTAARSKTSSSRQRRACHIRRGMRGSFSKSSSSRRGGEPELYRITAGARISGEGRKDEEDGRYSRLVWNPLR